MAGPEKTDADLAAEEAARLAAANAAMIAATEEAKAARLPSAVRAAEVLNGDVMAAAISTLRDTIAANVDDLPRALGTQGAEGTKQMLQRIVTSCEAGLSAAQNRVAALQPAARSQPAPDEPET